MLQRAYEWFSGLNLIQKVLAVLFAALFLFSLSYLLTTGVLYLGGAGDRADSPIEEGDPNPASPGTSASASASAEATVPDNKLSITGARWEGEKAVVEGTWKGEVSSVHCDLLEGAPRVSPRGGGIARSGRRSIGRGRPSSRSSSRPGEARAGSPSTGWRATAWCARGSSPAAGR